MDLVDLDFIGRNDLVLRGSRLGKLLVSIYFLYIGSYWRGSLCCNHKEVYEELTIT